MAHEGLYGMNGSYGGASAGGGGGNYISGAINQAFAQPQVAPGFAQQAGSFGAPQAQQPGFWDKFNAFMTEAGPGIGAAADQISRIGMPEQIFRMDHPVPDARPAIGPGITGLQALAASFQGRG